MNFTILMFVSLVCGLTLAQDDGNTTALEKPTEVQLCTPEMCDFVQELIAMRDKLGVMEIRLKESENQVLKKKEKTVVFSAAMVGSAAVGPFNTDTILIYGRVNLNIGNGYSHFTGIFRAPVAGIYYFTFFYHAGGDHRVSLSLIKNNEVVIGTFDHSSEHDASDNGGNAVFLRLQREDQVFMRLGANTNVWGDGARTTFSGCLVSSV